MKYPPSAQVTGISGWGNIDVLRGPPQAVLGLGIALAEGCSQCRGKILHAVEAALEFPHRSTQEGFRIKPCVAGEIDATKKQIADFIGDGVRVGACEGSVELGHFFPRLR